MSLERKPAGPSTSDFTPPRTLKAASNPAQRLQELLRREAQAARDAQAVAPPATPLEEPISTAVLAPVEAPAPIVLPASEPLTPTLAAPADPLLAAPEEPPIHKSAAIWKKEPVLLIVVVNSERSTPVEYASIDDLPTVSSLEESHGAFLLSEEWQRRGPILMRVVRLRRRRR